MQNKARFRDSNKNSTCKDHAVRTMATSVIYSTFTPAATAPLHTDWPASRYCREKPHCVAKLRYAVKFECNVAPTYMNFKLNNSLSKTQCCADSISQSHVLLIYASIPFHVVRDHRVRDGPKNDSIQPGGAGRGGQLMQTRWLLTALPFKAKGGVIIVRMVFF